ncbi:MAG: hypothetical protein AAF393_06455 [Pseudomonadota bacterium]
MPVPGTAQQCDPNYAEACVPIARDVDCKSGSGNGPAYVKGPVVVIGRDIYRLDRDGDKLACEKNQRTRREYPGVKELRLKYNL